MRKTIIALLAAIAFAACNPIDKDDYLVYVEPTTVNRAVLIEDFTGQRCPNCPEASELIEQLKTEFGEENIVAVGIHTPPMGFAGSARLEGLMTSEGEAYGQAWNINAQPIGLINRTGGLQDRMMWMTEVSKALQQKSPVQMAIATTYDKETESVSIDVELTAFDDISAKLQLWIVEDDIKALQTMPDGSNNSKYVHQHVFRSTVNGLWGDDINVAYDKTINKNYTFAFDSTTLPQYSPAYVPENCSVVAFVYNDKDGVLQATKCKVVK